MQGLSNRHWDEHEILKHIDDTPKTAEIIREAMGISPYDKRECYRLGQTLHQMANEGMIWRDKGSQTFRKIKPATSEG